MQTRRHKSPIDASAIIERLKQSLGVETDAELANYLGIDPRGISNWRARQTVPMDLILTKCGHVDLNYVFRGAASAVPVSANQPSVAEQTSDEATYAKIVALAKELGLLEYKLAEAKQENVALKKERDRLLSEHDAVLKKAKRLE